MGTGTTATQAAARSRLISVESYAVFLDLTTSGDTARSRTEIQSSCREPGAAPFADVDALTVHEVVLNGTPMPVDPTQAADGRLLGGFRERYFAHALAAIGQHDARTAQRLARALYPATLADDATLAATDAAVARMDPADPVRAVLAEQRTSLQREMTARARFASAAPAG